VRGTVPIFGPLPWTLGASVVRKLGTVPLFLLVFTGCPPLQQVREICGNGYDDDNNGFADCADVDCAGQSGCPVDGGGNFGNCNKCGNSCTNQTACLQYGYGSDAPLPDCAGGRCQSFNMALQVAVTVKTDTGGWNFVTPTPRSMQMRFIRKTALDGSAVSCATVQAVASGTAATNADQIEKSGKFNLIGFDVTPISSVGSSITQPFVNVATAQDFLIWVEIWYGPRDATTKLPTQTRAGWGCFESGSAVAPFIPADNCTVSPTSPTCRTITVEMPGPQ
jgi:hypothetical protein